MRVERFYKTLKKDFLAGKTFEGLKEAQSAIDGWVVDYNTERPHQGIGMVPPIRRFELAVPEPFEVVTAEDWPPDPDPVEVVVTEESRRVTCKVSQSGRISLSTFRYHIPWYGRWTRRGTSASPPPPTGSATPTAGNRSKYGWSGTLSRSHRPASCSESMR